MMRAARLPPCAQSPVRLVVSSKGGECRREVGETGKRDTTKGGEDPGVDLLPVAPNVEVGGPHLQATSERDDERILEWSRVCLACVCLACHPNKGASGRRHSFAPRDSRQTQAASSETPQKAPVAERRRLHQPTSKVDAAGWDKTARADVVDARAISKPRFCSGQKSRQFLLKRTKYFRRNFYDAE